MTTSDFIKMLQEADPRGTSHVRINGEVPFFAELKQGYWDGPYSYINEEGKWVYTTQGNKVDIYFKSKEDMLDKLFDKHNPYKDSYDNLWDKAKEMFIFELSYFDKKQLDERVEQFLEPVKEHFDWYVDYHKNSWNKELDEVINLVNKGARFFQKRNVKLKYYEGWKFEGGGSACLAYTYPILESGRFEMLDMDQEYIEWILIQ